MLCASLLNSILDLVQNPVKQRVCQQNSAHQYWLPLVCSEIKVSLKEPQLKGSQLTSSSGTNGHHTIKDTSDH
jgi:hypothetical protein